MTTLAVTSHRPGPAVRRPRPVDVLLALLVTGLLALLPCAGSASAAGLSSTDGAARHPAPVRPPLAGPPANGAQRADLAHSAHTVRPAQQSTGARGHLPLSWCSATGSEHRPGNDGCSSHPFCGQESQLPNAPPQPMPACAPQLALVPAAPAGGLASSLPSVDLAPDLHVLQVHRT